MFVSSRITRNVLSRSDDCDKLENNDASNLYDKKELFRNEGDFISLFANDRRVDSQARQNVVSPFQNLCCSNKMESESSNICTMS